MAPRCVFIVILGLLALVSACGTRAPVVLTVYNYLDRAVTKIEQKACGAPDDAFIEWEDSTISRCDSPPDGCNFRDFVLPPTCVDLVAHDERGVVGEIRELRAEQSFPWVLRP